MGTLKKIGKEIGGGLMVAGGVALVVAAVIVGAKVGEKAGDAAVDAIFGKDDAPEEEVVIETEESEPTIHIN